MSSLFYKYIANLVVKSLEKNVLAGDKYHLQLDNKEEIDGFLDGLKSLENTKEFHFTHEDGNEPYETICFNLQGIKLIIGSTSDGVQPDFLVMLRNKVSEQKGEWKNTALLSIMSEQLDSIQGGSSNLEKEGMPLNSVSIYDNLIEKIKLSKLDQAEQFILHDTMKSLIEEQSFRNISFFDFLPIFSTLERQVIDEDTYKVFGIFKDDDLNTFTGKERKTRLDKNRELFSMVEKFHNLGLDETDLQKLFDEKGLRKIKKDDWEQLSFSEVYKYHLQYLESKKDKKIQFENIEIDGEVKYWKKQHSKTAAGKRKFHLIIFNDNQLDEINLKFNFHIEGGNVKSLSEKFFTISGKSNVITSVSKKAINAKIMPLKNELHFIRLVYKHDKSARLGAEFHIVIVPFEEALLETIKTSYLVDVSNEQIITKTDVTVFQIAEGLNEVNEKINCSEQTIQFNKLKDRLTFSIDIEAFDEQNEVKVHLHEIEQEHRFTLLIKNESVQSTPITSLDIWRLKREKQCHFQWTSNNRLILGTKESYMHQSYLEYFQWEKKWRAHGFKSGVIESGQLYYEDIEVGVELKEAYNRYCNYFKGNLIPSLAYMDDELKVRAESYIRAFINEVKSFQNSTEAGKKGQDLFRLGTITSKDVIYFTPYHPIMVAFQLKLKNELLSESVPSNILKRLSPESLIPYLYNDEGELFRPEFQDDAFEWLVFKPVNQVTVADADQFLSHLVLEKIDQFIKHFHYLFSCSSEAPLLINAVNIENDKELLKGIINWMLKQIKDKGTFDIFSIQITLYKNEESSYFDHFSKIKTAEEFEEIFGISLKLKDFSSEEILGIIREKFVYYKKDLDEPFNYAHICFYKMMSQEKYSLQPMKEMETGIALEGLYSAVPYMKGSEDYRNGFGVKHYSFDNNLLIEAAYYLNELIGNLINQGYNRYHKDEAILARTTINDEILENIYQSSHWVTFVDPGVDLEFFYNNEEDLIVIHYNDQYSSFRKYDAITVTKKFTQYFEVVGGFLQEHKISVTDNDINNIIKAFNTFNGEWLLRIVSKQGYYPREKFSIISAIKYCLAYFDHEDILWVPVSLEEIVRVAGVIGLSKQDGIFTAKNLGVKGSQSDDILLIGLNQREEQLKFYFYPVEVKTGEINSGVINKAKEQVKTTKNTIVNAITSKEDFTSKFYRNFFIQLFIANAKMIEQSDLWDKKNYFLSDAVIEKLLKDQFVISNELEKFVGIGAILSFSNHAFYRSTSVEEDVLIINLTKFDGYSGLVQPINEMHNWIQTGESDFIKENLLSYQINSVKEVAAGSELASIPLKILTTSQYNKNSDDPSMITKMEESNKEHVDYDSNNKYILNDRNANKEEIVRSNQKDVLLETKDKLEMKKNTMSQQIGKKQSQKSKLKNARILIGKIENSEKKVYWEYGNKDLANRHMLISGKSGQGKTYFMQCLLFEKSRLGIPSIVVDYTEGFLPDQLEPEFIEKVGNKLKQRVVYNEKLPINPFLKNTRNIGGIELPESDTDVSERIKSVFSAVYPSLGIQQLNSIYEATLNGLMKFDDKMNLLYLKSELEKLDNNSATKALSQIRPLIDRNPFASKNTINWEDIIFSDGEIHIIQLTAYPRDVQLIITEFLLWDLWNYSIREGNKDTPIPVILDEAQNLDHTENSPSAKILTEGRKFGWSAWYATQFLKAQLSVDQLARLQNSSQKVYFAPPEQEVGQIASGLSKDNNERKFWEKKLSELKKGQCVFHGPILLDNGELSKPMAAVVNILPLSER